MVSLRDRWKSGRKETPYTELGLRTQVAPQARQVQKQKDKPWGAVRLGDASL